MKEQNPLIPSRSETIIVYDSSRQPITNRWQRIKIALLTAFVLLLCFSSLIALAMIIVGNGGSETSPISPGSTTVVPAEPPESPVPPEPAEPAEPPQPPVEAGPQAGDSKTLNVDGIDYVFHWCPPGNFRMGSDKTEWVHEGKHIPLHEGPIHEVKITKGFWLLETEVTVGMFAAFVKSTNYHSQGNRPWGMRNGKLDSFDGSWENPGYSQDSNHPVTCVSNADVAAFCEWLSKKLNEKVQLPSEAQWEYACRAGTTDDYAGNLDEMGWYRNNSSSKPHAVKEKKPNAWGLYDLHGNVWEWCQDWYGENFYAESPQEDPLNQNPSKYSISRGGGWWQEGFECRSADRGPYFPQDRSNNLGFRVLFIPSHEAEQNP